MPIRHKPTTIGFHRKKVQLYKAYHKSKAVNCPTLISFSLKHGDFMIMNGLIMQNHCSTCRNLHLFATTGQRKSLVALYLHYVDVGAFVLISRDVIARDALMRGKGRRVWPWTQTLFLPSAYSGSVLPCSVSTDLCRRSCHLLHRKYLLYPLRQPRARILIL